MNASTTDSALGLQARIRAERVGMVYANTGPALFGNLLVAFLGMIVLFPVAPTLASLTWFLGFISIITVRWSLGRAYDRLADRRGSADIWARRLLAVVTLNGLCWGAFAILMLAYANPLQIGFGPFVVGGMVAASVATLGPLKSAYLGFTLPIVSGLILGLVWRGGYDALFMAAFTVAFEITMIGTVKKVSGIVGRNIELRLQNERLVESLTAANQSLGHEIEERRRAEARSEFLASHDALTGLPNRRLQKDHFAEAVAQVARGGGAAAVLFVDLDRFKQVNDTLGHPTGDALLERPGRSSARPSPRGGLGLPPRGRRVLARHAERRRSRQGRQRGGASHPIAEHTRGDRGQPSSGRVQHRHQPLPRRRR